MDTTSSLRKVIQSLSSKRSRRRYPPALRARIAAHARQRQEEGITPWQTSQRLDMGEGTLRRILAEDHSRFLLPVRVTDNGEAMPVFERFVVHGGHGVRVECLNVQELSELLRALG